MDPVPFYVDASMLGVAGPLAQLRPEIYYPGQPGCPITSPQTNDDVWVPIVAANGWAIILLDKKVRSRPGERLKLLEAGARAFCLTGSGNDTKWEQMRLLALHWDTMETTARQVEAPFMYSVTRSGGVRRLMLE